MSIIKIKNQMIWLLSDTHGRHRFIEIPEDIDIVIHCGDICDDGNPEQVTDFFKWYSGLNIRYKLFVHGNHDWPFQMNPEESRQLIPRNVKWLNDTSILLKELRIKSVSDSFRQQENINSNEQVDILVGHYPPVDVLDNGFGIDDLKEYVDQIQPTYYVFGHNHAGTGKLKIGKTQFLNVSLYEELF